MTSIIIEDQEPAQRILQRYIAETSSLKLQRVFCDALEAKAYLQDHAVDLIFLDIDLPRLSGMDFLRSQQGHPLTILTTAYAEFALESYQFKVVDYLLKPFSFERFSKAIEKVNSIAASARHVTESNIPSNEACLYIKSNHNIVKVNRDEIIFIRSDSDYTEVVTTNNMYLTSDALKEWMTKLDKNFSQVHKSYIINTNHLSKISHNRIHLDPDHIIPIGRAYKKPFMARMAELK